MDLSHSADSSVMDLVRSFFRYNRLFTVVLFVILAGCSENKRNPPDDGDGDFSKKSASCQIYLDCVAERGSTVLADWGVEASPQSALLNSCADLDVSLLPENVQNAYSALLDECAQ